MSLRIKWKPFSSDEELLQTKLQSEEKGEVRGAGGSSTPGTQCLEETHSQEHPAQVLGAEVFLFTQVKELWNCALPIPWEKNPTNKANLHEVGSEWF